MGNLIKQTSLGMVIYNGSDIGVEGGFGQFVTLLINVGGKREYGGPPF